MRTSRSPVRFCPGTQGGNEWNGPAYHPELNLVFVGAKDWCTTVHAMNPDSLKAGPGETSTPMLAAVTPTAGGVLFTGELNGDAVARDPETGEELWRQRTGNAIGGGVVTYEAGGKQYVAVAAGMKSPIWPVPSETSRIVVYGLP